MLTAYRSRLQREVGVCYVLSFLVHKNSLFTKRVHENLNVQIGH